MKAPMWREIYRTEKNTIQTYIFSDTDAESFMAPFLLCWVLFRMCMVRCGRSAVFVWLCKPHTIEGQVLCHATVVNTTNLLKRRGISASARTTVVYSIGESVQGIHRLLNVVYLAPIRNTPRTTAAGRLITLCTYL